MTKIRLLPIVLFAATALLALKLVGLTTGLGSFRIGPAAAIAAGAEGGHGGGEAAATPAGTSPPINPLLTAPIDLASEAAALEKKNAAGGGHGAPAGEHGAPAADAHGAETPAPADAHGAEAPAPADAHGAETPAPADAQGAEAPAPADAHGAEAAAPADGHGATPSPAPEGHGAPAAEGHGDSGGHGAGAKSALTTTRPEEYVPPDPTSESAVLDALAARRKALDERETEMNLRLKLLEAAEVQVQRRIDELKAIETQLGTAAAEANKDEGESLTGLVSMYENMKPKAAAQVFNELPMDVLVSLVRKMNPRKTAGIIAAMAPDRAGRLTAALAGQQAPTEIVVRRDGDFAAPGAAQVEPGLDALPKIMPAKTGEGG